MKNLEKELNTLFFEDDENVIFITTKEDVNKSYSKETNLSLIGVLKSLQVIEKLFRDHINNIMITQAYHEISSINFPDPDDYKVNALIKDRGTMTGDVVGFSENGSLLLYEVR